MGQIAVRIDHALRTYAERLDVAIAGDRGGPAGGGIDGPQRTLAEVIRDREQALTVAGPGKAVDRSVPVLRERPLHAARQVEEHQVKAIGLVSRPLHGSI